MPTYDEIKKTILDPMQALYRSAHTDPTMQAAALREYATELSRFSGADLAAGWQRLKGTHTKTTWPVLADILKAISEATEHKPASGPSPAAMKAYAKDRSKQILSEWKTRNQDHVRMVLANGWIYDLTWFLQDAAEYYAQCEWLITNGQTLRRKDGSIVRGLPTFNPPGAFAERYKRQRPAATEESGLSKHLAVA